MWKSHVTVVSKRFNFHNPCGNCCGKIFLCCGRNDCQKSFPHFHKPSFYMCCGNVENSKSNIRIQRTKAKRTLWKIFSERMA
jgi:hypothetical protein